MNGVRIGGISGIFKGYDFRKGHFEFPPYDENTKRSVYHIRSSEVFRLKQLTPKIDIMLSHDWPKNVHQHGNFSDLAIARPQLKVDIEKGKLGSPPCRELLNILKPRYWFSAHLHCKFVATVEHSDTEQTDFMALDQCLPQRNFLEIIALDDKSTPDQVVSLFKKIFIN